MTKPKNLEPVSSLDQEGVKTCLSGKHGVIHIWAIKHFAVSLMVYLKQLNQSFVFAAIISYNFRTIKNMMGHKQVILKLADCCTLTSIETAKTCYTND